LLDYCCTRQIFFRNFPLPPKRPDGRDGRTWWRRSRYTLPAVVAVVVVTTTTATAKTAAAPYSGHHARDCPQFLGARHKRRLGCATRRSYAPASNFVTVNPGSGMCDQYTSNVTSPITPGPVHSQRTAVEGGFVVSPLGECRPTPSQAHSLTYNPFVTTGWGKWGGLPTQ
jgi:hypothetical protein